MATRNSTGAPRAKRSDTKFTEADAVREFNRVKRAKPLLTQEDVDRIDRDLWTGPMGVSRRIALVSLTNPAKVTVDACKDRETAAAFAEGVLCIRETVTNMRALVELIETAEWRMSVALCQRADMAALFAEAEGRVRAKADGAGVTHG